MLLKPCTVKFHVVECLFLQGKTDGAVPVEVSVLYTKWLLVQQFSDLELG